MIRFFGCSEIFVCAWSLLGEGRTFLDSLIEEVVAALSVVDISYQVFRNRFRKE